MKRVVLTDTGGNPSIADKRFTGTRENMSMNDTHKRKPAKVGFHLKTHIVSSLLPQVIEQQDATTINWKQKILIFFRLISLLRIFTGLSSILSAVLLDTQQRSNCCSYSFAFNIYYLSKLNLISFDKLDRNMEALCLKVCY